MSLARRELLSRGLKGVAGLAAVGVMPNLLAACGGTKTSSTGGKGADAGGGAAPAKVVRVGLVIPGNITDLGYMQSAHEGLLAAEKKHGAAVKTRFVENVTTADIEQTYATLAANSDLVIGISGRAYESGFKMASRFPDVKFVTIGKGGDGAVPANFSNYDLRQAEVGYLAGAAAALLSKTGVVGFVGGAEVPGVVNARKEFGNGALRARPDIVYVSKLTGDFDDIAKAKEAALAGIASKVDVTYQILNNGLRGLEQAAKETDTKIFGSYAARCATSPLYAGFTVTNVGFAVNYAVDQMVADQWTGERREFGLAAGPEASGVVICGNNPALVAKLEEIRTELVSGKITTLLG